MRLYDLKSHCPSSLPLGVTMEMPSRPKEPEHLHDCYELMIFLQGEGWCAVGGKKYPVHQGSVFLIAPGVTHEYSIPLGTSFYNVMFLPELLPPAGIRRLEEFARQGGGRCPAYRLPQLKGVLEHLIRELDRQNDGFECLCSGLLTLLLAAVTRETGEVPLESGDHPEDELAPVFACIRENYSRRITLADLGRTAGKSAVWVGRIFRKRCGTSVALYLSRYRVSRAKELLETTQYSLTRIAYLTGFYDSSHFSRVFRRETGITPLRYRQQNGNHKLPD